MHNRPEHSPFGDDVTITTYINNLKQFYLQYIELFEWSLKKELTNKAKNRKTPLGNSQKWSWSLTGGVARGVFW